MAATDSIRTNLSDLESVLHEAKIMALCFSQATAFQTSDEETPWVGLLVNTIHKLDNAAQALIIDVNTKCIPFMKDVESVTRKS